MGERAHSTADLSNRNGFASTHQTLTVASHFVEPERESQTKRSWLGVNAMRASHLRSVFKLQRAPLQRLEQRVHFFKQDVRGIAQQQRVRGIDDVRRGQTIMNK